MNQETGFPFFKALSKRDLSFICEVKKASPSKGIIAQDFPYMEIAADYEERRVFGVAYIPGLYHFLSDRFNPFAVPFTCQPPCGVTFPDVGIYTGDKKSSFHICVFLCATM